MHSGPQRERDRSDFIFLFVLLSAFIALATWISFRKSIWLDETFTLDRTGTSLDLTLHLARYRSLKPPLYFVLVYYWRHLGDSIEFVRALSTVSVAIALIYLHRISLALGIGRGWRSLALIGALTPHMIWAAIEARAYGLTIMCLVASTYYFIRLFVTDSEKPWLDSVLFVLFGYAGILSFYYAGFILAGLFVAGLFGRDQRRLVWSGVALAVLLVPWLTQVGEHVGEQGNYMPPLELATNAAAQKAGALAAWLAGLPTEIVFRHVALLSRPGVEAGLLLLGLTLIGLRIGLGRPRWSRPETILWVAAGVAVGLLAAIRISNVQMMDLRHWSIAAPMLLVLPPLLASHLRPASAARAAAAGILAIFALTAASYARNEEGPHDAQSAARLVMEEERPGEPIFYFFGSPAAFSYYYHGSNPIRRLPIDPRAQPLLKRSAPLGTADSLHLANLMAEADTTDRSLWVVEDIAPSQAVGIVQATFPEQLEVTGRWQYYQITVTHLRFSSPVARQP